MKTEEQKVDSTTHSRWRSLWTQALLGAALTALFAAGSLTVPPIAHAFFSADMPEPLGIRSIPGLIDRSMQMDKIETFLDDKISANSVNPNYVAWRGRLEAKRNGNKAGFALLRDLLKNGAVKNEEIAALAELARLAKEIHQWDDFFALCAILLDYGEIDIVGALAMADNDARAAMLSTPEGQRFFAFSEWNLKQKLPPSSPETASWLRLWSAESKLRREIESAKTLGDDAIDAEECNAVADERPDDPRAYYIQQIRKNVPASKPLASPIAPPATLGKQIGDRKKFDENGAWETAFAAPLAEIWLIVQSKAFLQVYPLVIVELDDEVSIHYLHYPRPFPMRLARRDTKPFHGLRITYVNDFQDESLKLSREFEIQGIYSPNLTSEGNKADN